MKVTLPTWLPAIGMIATSSIALAGPAGQSRAFETCPTPDPKATAIIADIISAHFQTGFALNDLERMTMSPPELTAATSFPQERLGEDVSEFISAHWREQDADVMALSSPTLQGYELIDAPFVSAASPEMDALSVPHIPLPAGIVPGVIGVAMAAYVHHRSLKSRKS